MGITGTDITKQAAGIVLADDNFQSIVDAVQEGRRTYDNIKKFILYLLSCNFSEIGLMLSAVAIDAPLPLSPIQILWANLIADTPPALSLGVESPEQNIMMRKPRNPKSGIFTFRTVLLLLYYSTSMSMLPLAGLLIADRVEGYTLLHAQTLAFSILVSVQLVHAFLSRSMHYSVIERHPFGNRWLLGAFVLSGSLLVLSLYIPGINTLLDLVPLTWWDWCKIGIAIVIHVVLVESMKFIVRVFSLLMTNKNSTFYTGI